MEKRLNWGRFFLGGMAVAGLGLVFLFQGLDVAAGMGVQEPMARFLVNRSLRFLVNDMLAIVLIYSIFKARKYVVFAILVQLLGMIFILIPYFIIKINFPTYNGPLISFLHRLVLNPTLLLILIPAFFYQRQLKTQDK